MDSSQKFQKSYFDVLGLCCSSEIPMIERILASLDGIKDFSVIIPTKTLIVVHDSLLISPLQIVKALNQARLEANIRSVYGGGERYKNKWPSPYAVASGTLLLLSFLKYVYSPMRWLAIGAIAVGIPPIVLKAVAAVRNFRLEINILVLITVAGSIALRDYWEAGTIVFLFTISEWLESRASHKATAVMSSLVSVVPQRAVLADTGEEVDADEVKLNTILAVKAGEVIPIDGVVVEGNCEVDEKTMTGESFPVAKQKDSTVWASTINLNGYISIKTTAVAEDCVVARMAKIVEEAQNKKSRTQRFMDKCAKYYTPAIVAVSAALAIVPLAAQVQNKKEWYHLALVVLVSGCPCALLLSTPVAMFCALTKAATLGVLFKGAEHLENLARIKIMAFDKTGTITRGEFLVVDFKSLRDDISLDTLLYWISSVECKSSHPMAAALVEFARAHAVEPKPDSIEKFQNFPGEGICGKIEDNEIYIGNWKIASRAGATAVPNLEGYDTEGKSVGYVFLGSSPAGIFCLSDMCRTGAKEAIEELKSIGIKTVMLTGDCHGAAKRAQEQLGGALEVVHAELLPEHKASIVKELQKEGRAAMIGDGLNDAPALATADIGISMGVSGSALATESGDIVLMSNDIQRIPKAVRIAKKVRRKIIENVIVSVSTKAAILVLAIAGHPLVWAAVLADVGTCLLVIFNSMLLLRGTDGRGKSCCRSTTHSHFHKHKSAACSSAESPKTCEPHSCSSKSCVSKCSSSDSSSGSCGDKKHSSSAKEHRHNPHPHSHNEITDKDHQCCHKAEHDLESQRAHIHDRCSENASCSENNNSCEKSVLRHETEQCEDHNHSTSCKNSPQPTVSNEQPTPINHDLTPTTSGKQEGKCCSHAPRQREGLSGCGEHASEYGKQRSHVVNMLGCKNNEECKADHTACATSKKMHVGCCESFRRECCIRNGQFGTSFRGGLSEIVID
ncbi:Cadmium/zinc-transporting ATPase HMA2 [Sesamum alatum]|uniref:Cadmium/zinc-transporting ATPase HMA2 n=1 Tax=Sesamum alatum TaxID=300844 RepID=A0AAE2CSC6_9LAMI|nr:Cadmium/zinc-transporting ATPase HMA2 [Sesamum alatum]